MDEKQRARVVAEVEVALCLVPPDVDLEDWVAEAADSVVDHLSGLGLIAPAPNGS